MALVTCPKCQFTVRKGSWEIFTHCPECGTEWSVSPDEPKRVKRKIIVMACACAMLSFVPVIGAVFGLFGLFWGYMAVRSRRVVLGTTVMLVSMIVGAAGQPLLTYWGTGYLKDSLCTRDLGTLSRSIRAYREQTGQYPDSLAALSELGLPAPKECRFGGGKYFYLSPSACTHPTTSTGPATTSSGPSSERLPPASAATSRRATSRLAGPRPTTGEATTAPMPDVSGDSRTLLVAEVARSHRYVRMCITTDDEVRALPHKEFDRLLELPRNEAFAKGLHAAWKASTQPAKTKPTSAPASTSTSAPATAGAPVTSQATTATQSSANLPAEAEALCASREEPSCQFTRRGDE